jgi:hypothetical protein
MRFRPIWILIAIGLLAACASSHRQAPSPWQAIVAAGYANVVLEPFQAASNANSLDEGPARLARDCDLACRASLAAPPQAESPSGLPVLRVSGEIVGFEARLSTAYSRLDSGLVYVKRYRALYRYCLRGEGDRVLAKGEKALSREYRAAEAEDLPEDQEASAEMAGIIASEILALASKSLTDTVRR